MVEKPIDPYAPSARPKDNQQLILILTTDEVQDLEFFYPYYRFTEEGYRVDVATPKGGEFKGKMGMGLKQSRPAKDIDPNLYQLLYIPGGKAPAALKKSEDSLKLIYRFAQTGKPIAAICHGPQVLAAANLIKGRRIAAWPEVEKEVKEAGATYVNEPTVVDGQFITARWPGDLPVHLARTLQILQSTRQGTARTRVA
jgi:protease I